MDVTFAVRLVDVTLVNDSELPPIDTVVSEELYPVPVKVTGVFPEPRNTEVGVILEIVGERYRVRKVQSVIAPGAEASQLFAVLPIAVSKTVGAPT